MFVGHLHHNTKLIVRWPFIVLVTVYQISENCDSESYYLDELTYKNSTDTYNATGALCPVGSLIAIFCMQ